MNYENTSLEASDIRMQMKIDTTSGFDRSTFSDVPTFIFFRVKAENTTQESWKGDRPLAPQASPMNMRLALDELLSDTY